MQVAHIKLSGRWVKLKDTLTILPHVHNMCRVNLTLLQGHSGCSSKNTASNVTNSTPPLIVVVVYAMHRGDTTTASGSFQGVTSHPCRRNWFVCSFFLFALSSSGKKKQKWKEEKNSESKRIKRRFPLNKTT